MSDRGRPAPRPDSGPGGRSRDDRRQHRAGAPRHRSEQRPSERAHTTDPPRRIAYDLMRAVDAGAYANLELPKRLRAARLTGRDAAFVTELVYGATRLRGFYDPVLARCAGRELSAIDAEVLDVLRLGAHQSLSMRVRQHAAVGETVALARDVLGTGRAGFVNAVLRRVSEKDIDAWRTIVAGPARAEGSGSPHPARPADVPDTPSAPAAPAAVHSVDPVAASGAADAGPDAAVRAGGAAARAGGAAARAGGAAAWDAERIAIRHSHPAWVVRALRAALLGHGASAPETVDADLIALLEADNDAPIVSLVARPGLADVAELVAGGARPSRLSPVGAVLAGGGDPGGLPAVRDARAGVQDEGSQLIPLALVARAEPGERWLDLCAGPGGKAALLAALARRHDAVLFANELSDHRTELVHQAVRAAVDAGAEVMVGTGDGRDVGAEETDSFDRVLLDAPCTGLGALRRRPEARWRRNPDDVGDLARLQGELLASALDAVRPGGVVGYATCSPHLAETRFVVGDALKRRADVEAVDARPLFRDAEGEPIADLGDGPYVQLWPHVHGTDAMFFALLRKRD